MQSIEQPATSKLPLLRGAGVRFASLRAKMAWGLRRTLAAPLEWRFMASSVLVLVTGAFVIGSWTTSEIKDRVIDRAAATNALYVESFVGPLVQPLEHADTLPPENVAALRGLLDDTVLGDEFVSFKVWSTDGTIVYASDDRLVGRTFKPDGHMAQALAGEVAAHVSDLSDEENQYERVAWKELLEMYSPIHSQSTGEIIAISEFYQSPSDVFGEVQSSQMKAWMIVAVSTLVMFVVLNGMVRQASKTIRQQSARLDGVNRRLREASASKVQTEELALTRLAQDLHDAPAQGLAVALLRLDRLKSSTPAPIHGDWELVRTSVSDALTEIRDISTGIRMPELEGLDAREVIKAAVTDFSRRTERVVRTSVHGASVWLSAAASVSIYRILQEALNNSHLHANCSVMSVNGRILSSWLEVEIADNGLGFNPDEIYRADREDRPHLGIRGMRDRVELLGGTFRFISKPDQGTQVIVRIPVEESGAP